VKNRSNWNSNAARTNTLLVMPKLIETTNAAVPVVQHQGTFSSGSRESTVDHLGFRKDSPCRRREIVAWLFTISSS